MAHEFSTKRIAIDKANATLVLAVAISAFVVVFSLVASKALLDQRSYQSKVISKKEKAVKTLKNNVRAADQLTNSYREFAGATTNVLGGNPAGDADKDGDNARIILDALPSKYDFPALTTSIEKLLKDNGLAVKSIKGIDQEVTLKDSGTSNESKQVEIPFAVELKINDQQLKLTLELFERSIRPFKINKMDISVKNDQVELKLDAVSYFQPEKKLDIKTEVVK